MESPQQQPNEGAVAMQKERWAEMACSMTCASVADCVQICAGGVAGAVGKTCTAPLSRITVLMQIGRLTSQVKPTSLDHGRAPNGGFLREACRIASEEGVRAFWKGNGVAVLHRIPYSSISFYSYEKFKKALPKTKTEGCDDGHREARTLSLSQKILAGEAAATTAVCATYPLDLVKTRLAAQKSDAYYRGILHALFKIPQDEGLMGLYKGMGATLLSVGPNVAINFCVYETLKARFSHRMMASVSSDQKQIPSPFWSLAFGSISAIASSTFTFPLHVVRRRKQLEGAAGERAAVSQKRSLLGMIVHIAQREGFFRGFYRGILPEYLKVVPSVGITFATYEYLKTAYADD